MRVYDLKPHLGLFFILAVLLPSVILAMIGARAINREELYIARRYEAAISAEVRHAASLVSSELNKIGDDLSRSAPEYGDMAAKLRSWPSVQPLARIPFLLSNQNEVLWPTGNTPEEKEFLFWNMDFFANKAKVPDYQNIAQVYQEKIVSPPQKTQSQRTYAADQEFSVSSASQDSSYDRQMAQSRFDQYEPVREQVYAEAKKEGQRVETRNVLGRQALNEGSAKMAKGIAAQEDNRSLYISKRRKFKEITGANTQGIIPRFVDDKLSLIFWKKISGEKVVGCVLSMTQLRQRIIGVLPDIYSKVRLLTVLDQNGRPLISPLEDTKRDWRRPFASREVSELLPRWEVAAYLNDPAVISSQANFMSALLWGLIFILFASITIGGILILRAVNHEMALARQKTTFAANVSHELKTPLTSIRMFAEMLKEKRQADVQKQEQYLDHMVSETQRLTNLINNVLDFSRIGQGRKLYNMKSLDLAALCREVAENQRVGLESVGFKLELKVPGLPLMVKADSEALKQVLINLLSNAQKYYGEKKDIEVEAAADGAWACVSVKDRGIGVPVKHAKNIFKEFFRVDDALTSRVKGTGLGLTIARMIARDHGGDVVYMDREGGGSVFQLRLPGDI